VTALSTPAQLSRRTFLKVSVSAAGGLIAELSWPAASSPRLRGASQREDAALLGAFVRIGADGRIVIGARGCEIGQGVRTSLPMLIAEELDVPWSAVTVEQLPYGLVSSSEPAGFTSTYGPQGAGGSTSVRQGWKDLRQAGAQIRWLLIRAAAQTWHENPDRLLTRDATVVHPDGRILTYGELAKRAAGTPLPKEAVALKSKGSYRVVGQPTRVVDAREIVTGAAMYGIDSTVSGALAAVIARCPYFDGSVVRVEDTQARQIPGVRHVVVISGPRAGANLDRNLVAGVAVVADDFWSAHKGRAALRVTWDRGPAAQDSSDALEARALAALTQQGKIARQDASFETARRSAARVVEAQYIEPLLAHATMEPPNALIDLRERRALLMASLQSPDGASRMISAMTGIPRPDIEIRLPRAGGGFGRRLANDFIAEAVLVAQAVHAPVKVYWTREDDLQNDFYRPFGIHSMIATLDSRRSITGWAHRVAATPRKYRAAGMEDDPDWIGCVDPDGFPAGCVPAYLSEFLPVDFTRARGWWRAPLPTFSAFPVQSFVDEIATAAGKDPLTLRLEMLGAAREFDYRDHGGPKLHTGRLANVLRRAAREIDYGRSLPPRHGIGLANHFTFGGYAAHAIEVVVSEQGELRVVRCACTVDVGEVVNPLGVEAQIMGATIDGLSTALRLQITMKEGCIEQSNFPDYPLLTMAAAPDVEVHILDSGFPPSGAGEMGIPTVAPALANAISAACGIRIRRLPIGRQLQQSNT
jgi:isoquinoline 1-oxidoreductase beta subunit